MLLTGDVNVHLHDTSSVHAVRFAAVLDDFDLRDIVGRPIHRGGHQLDILATRLHRPSYPQESTRRSCPITR